MARSRRPQQSSVPQEPRAPRAKGRGGGGDRPPAKAADRPGPERDGGHAGGRERRGGRPQGEDHPATPSNRLELELPRGARPRLVAPVILAVSPGRDYELLDSGDGEKFERYGDLRVRRPENQAIWPRRLGTPEWENADALFTGDVEEEGLGRWQFPREPLGETWPLAHDGMSYLGRFTSFRHVGVFPEQAAQDSPERPELSGRGMLGDAGEAPDLDQFVAARPTLAEHLWDAADAGWQEHDGCRGGPQHLSRPARNQEAAEDVGTGQR